MEQYTTPPSDPKAALPDPGGTAPDSACPLPGLAPAPGESPRAFEAFCAYLQLGPRRRYSALARKLGVSVRTIERWASQFDWRERLTAQAALGAGQFLQAQDAQRIETAVHEQSVRDRQLALAGAILDLTERYFERLDDMDLERIRLPEVCRALEFASRLAGQSRETDPTAASDAGLRDQLAALLDQAFRDQPKPASP
jgi:hypothetical protein